MSIFVRSHGQDSRDIHADFPAGKVPALRDHAEDIPLLVDYFIGKICEEYSIAPKNISRDAMDALKKMPWSGNIRELRNVIERLIVLSGEEITAEDIRLYC